jgi:uncharacterized protein (TIGR03086 family)
VAGHVIGGLGWAAALIGGATDLPSPADVDEAGPRVLAGDDPLAAWLAAREGLEAVCGPAALGRRVRWPFGVQTVDQGLEWFSLEVLVHTWDLAQAVGVDIHLDPELVRDHLVRLHPIGELLRGPGMYGPEIAAPDGADDQEQFLAFLGRKVAGRQDPEA